MRKNTIGVKQTPKSPETPIGDSAARPHRLARASKPLRNARQLAGGLEGIARTVSSDGITQAPYKSVMTLGAGSIVLILAAMEAQPARSTALPAYRRTLRRRREEIAAIGAPHALETVAERVAAVRIGRGPSRRATLAEVWAGLPAATPAEGLH